MVTTGNLAGWDTILYEWVALVLQSYARTSDAFPPYSHYMPYSFKEQTNVGFLASAATKAGWLAMVECAFTKNGADSPKKGSADLLLFGDGTRYFVEAKLTGDLVHKLKKKVEDRLKSAECCAHEMPKVRGAQQVGLAFVVPRFAADTSAAGASIHEVESELDEIIEHCRERKPDAFASVFPGSAPLPSNDSNDKGKCAYGLILIARAL